MPFHIHFFCSGIAQGNTFPLAFLKEIPGNREFLTLRYFHKNTFSYIILLGRGKKKLLVKTLRNILPRILQITLNFLALFFSWTHHGKLLKTHFWGSLIAGNWDIPGNGFFFHLGSWFTKRFQVSSTCALLHC